MLIMTQGQNIDSIYFSYKVVRERRKEKEEQVDFFFLLFLTNTQ
jgi:hypothetical protein